MITTTEKNKKTMAVHNGPVQPGSDAKKNRLLNGALVLVAFVLACGAIASGSYFRAEQGLQGITVNQPSNISIFAPDDMINTPATEHNRQEAQALADALPPIRVLDPNVWPLVEHTLDFLANNMTGIREFHIQEIYEFERMLRDQQTEFQAQMLLYNIAVEEWEIQRATIEAGNEDMGELPPRPVPPAYPEPIEPVFEVWDQFALLPVVFTEIQQQLIISMDNETYADLWETVIDVAYTVQATEISEVGPLTLHAVRENLGARPLSQNHRDIVERIVIEHLAINLIVDYAATQRQRDIVAADYIVVTLLEGQTIVNAGDIVTPDVYYILGELGLLEDVTISDFVLPIAGTFFITALLFLACIMYLSFYRPTIAANKREALLLFTLYVLVITLVWSFSDFGYQFLPILIFPMLVSVLIERRSAVILSFSLILICYFIVDGSWDYLMFFLVSGVLICMLSRFTTDRNKIFIVGTTVMLLQFTLSISIALITGNIQAVYDVTGLLVTAGYASLNGLLTVIISTGSLPIWETFFGVVTPVKLLDLTNPTNLLLRRLTIEAPGTYHHSLIVANLAESAAYDIGANAHAARVGGYYHDVGKLKYPQYFAENIDRDNPHDHLDPIESAQMIISHVSHGLTLAAEHRLPQFVRDIIQEHHGDSLIQFFYAKAKKSSEDVDEGDYRYPFIVPQTRESACVMLADTVEAAVRAMMPSISSENEMEDTINRLIRNKLVDGQLADSQLTIKDIAIISESFIRVLKGMYHERIPYPKLVPVEEAEAVISEG
ncbi:MAG: HDIG domain-containing protein [Defluviitaleaceae bacterium]|nr:HDIG domain-containing protein [Defluviitaleaceae bacterium]